MLPTQSLIACHDCDLLHHYQPLSAKKTAKCRRCGAILYAHKPNSLERTLALVCAAAVLFLLANTFPFLAMNMEGQIVHTTLLSGVLELYEQDMRLLALLVFITSILMPGLEIVGLLYILLPLQLRWGAPFASFVFRMLRKVKPWSMMEVFMLGLLVSVVKLNTMSEIISGVALWSFALLIFLLAWSTSTLDEKEVWSAMKWRQ